MRILIATDGSDYSKAAVEQACRLVINPLNAEILIVSAYEDTYPITAEPFAVSAEYYQQVEAAVRDQAGVFVEDAKKAIQDKFQGSGLVISTEVLRGSPDQEILNKAKECNADLIVVG